MNKKRTIGLVLMLLGTIVYFLLKDDISALISSLLIAASIPLLTIREKKQSGNQEE